MLTATRQTRKPLTAAHGSARWLCGPPTKNTLDGSVLVITPAGKAGQFYKVETIRDAAGRRVGYRLTKVDGEAETTTYDIDCTFSLNDPRHWGCDCPDGTFREDRPGGCKHIAGLVAALKVANLL